MAPKFLWKDEDKHVSIILCNTSLDRSKIQLKDTLKRTEELYITLKKKKVSFFVPGILTASLRDHVNFLLSVTLCSSLMRCKLSSVVCSGHQ